MQKQWKDEMKDVFGKYTEAIAGNYTHINFISEDSNLPLILKDAMDHLIVIKFEPSPSKGYWYVELSQKMEVY